MVGNGSRSHHWPQKELCTLGIPGRDSRTPNSPQRLPEWPRLWRYTNLPLQQSPQSLITPPFFLPPLRSAAYTLSPFPVLQHAVPTPCLWGLPTSHEGWQTPLSTVATALAAAGEGEARHTLKKSSKPPAYQAFTGEPHAHTLSLHKVYSTIRRQNTKLHGFLSCMFTACESLTCFAAPYDAAAVFLPVVSNGVPFPCSPPTAAPIWPCLSAAGVRGCSSRHPLFLSIWCGNHLPGTSKGQLASASKLKQWLC